MRIACLREASEVQAWSLGEARTTSTERQAPQLTTMRSSLGKADHTLKLPYTNAMPAIKLSKDADEPPLELFLPTTM